MKSPLTPFLIPHIWRQSYWLHLQTISRIWPLLLTTSSAPRGLNPHHQCYKTCLDNASSRSSPCPNPLSLQAVSATREIFLKYKSDHISPLLRTLKSFPIFTEHQSQSTYDSQHDLATQCQLPFYPHSLLLRLILTASAPERHTPTWEPLQWLYPLQGTLFLLPDAHHQNLTASPPSSLCSPVPDSVSLPHYPIQYYTQSLSHPPLSIPLFWPTFSSSLTLIFQHTI